MHADVLEWPHIVHVVPQRGHGDAAALLLSCARAARVHHALNIPCPVVSPRHRPPAAASRNDGVLAWRAEHPRVKKAKTTEATTTNAKSNTIDVFFRTKPVVAFDDDEYKALKLAAVRMIARTGWPPTMLDNKSLWDLLLVASRGALPQLPTSQTIRNKLRHEAADVTTTLRANPMFDGEAMLACTSDGWTGTGLKRCVVAVWRCTRVRIVARP